MMIKEPAPRGLSEVFERYALGLSRDRFLPEGGDGALERRRALVKELVFRGVRGWPEYGTFFTRRLAPGCEPCLKGKGSNLCLTTLCNRDCFFCFNPKPRIDSMSVHGRAVASESEIPGIVEGFGIRSLGLSGGEPLLDPARVLRILELLRERFGLRLRVDLYTNGELLTDDLLQRLLAAGLGSLRINVAAGGYKLSAVELALRRTPNVEVEIPAIPQHRRRLRRLVRELDGLGAPHLILHELFASAENRAALLSRGFRAAGRQWDKLTWSGVLDSDAAALETLLYALERARALSVYYCSCATQQWIAERALASSARHEGGRV